MYIEYYRIYIYIYIRIALRWCRLYTPVSSHREPSWTAGYGAPTEATSSGSETHPQQPWSRFAPATCGAGRDALDAFSLSHSWRAKVQTHSYHSLISHWHMEVLSWLDAPGTFRHFDISCGLTLHLFAHFGALGCFGMFWESVLISRSKGEESWQEAETTAWLPRAQ